MCRLRSEGCNPVNTINSVFCCTIKTNCINTRNIHLLDAGVRRHDGFGTITDLLYRDMDARGSAEGLNTSRMPVNKQ